MIYKSAELTSQLGKRCDVTCDMWHLISYIILTYEIVATMWYHCLVVTSILRQILRYLLSLYCILHALFKNTLLIVALSSSSLLFWELVLIFRDCSRLFLRLARITLRSYLNLILLLLWRQWELFIVLILFQCLLLMCK